MTTELSISDLQREISARRLPINVTQVMADGIMAVAAKAKDWPLLHEAVDAKIADQRDFVRWWDDTVRRRGGRGGYTDIAGREISPGIATIQTGIFPSTVSRWRTSLRDEDAYHLKIVVKACKAANVIPPDNHRANGTGDNEWFTPPEYIEAARTVLGTIDLDPASHEVAQRWIKATQYYTAADNALDRDWHGSVWLNPPYARGLIDAFAMKLIAQIDNGNVSAAVALTHNYTDTTWFHCLLDCATAVCFPRGRIKFLDELGEPCNPTQGQTFFYFGPNGNRFADVFEAFGAVLDSYV